MFPTNNNHIDLTMEFSEAIYDVRNLSNTGRRGFLLPLLYCHHIVVVLADL